MGRVGQATRCPPVPPWPPRQQPTRRLASATPGRRPCLRSTRPGRTQPPHLSPISTAPQSLHATALSFQHQQPFRRHSCPPAPQLAGFLAGSHVQHVHPSAQNDVPGGPSVRLYLYRAPLHSKQAISPGPLPACNQARRQRGREEPGQPADRQGQQAAHCGLALGHNRRAVPTAPRPWLPRTHPINSATWRHNAP